jgi:hypothetical protein
VKEHPVITQSVPPPVFGRDGDPCPSCGAPLAGDQRYCLHCGTRRPEARLEFLDVLDADVQARTAVSLLPPAAVGFAEPPRGLNARLQANSGVLGLTALLLVTLLIGLLVGHWATGSDSAPVAASAPAPQVIRVEGTAAPATASTATPPATESSSTPAPTTTTSKSSSKSDASTKATAPKDSVSVSKLSGKKAVDDAVKKGTPITTGGGKLPPKDDKAPGGGSAIEDIG